MDVNYVNLFKELSSRFLIEEDEGGFFEDILRNLPRRDQIKRLRSYYVFVYVRREKQERDMSARDLNRLLEISLGRGGFVIRTKLDKLYALVPRWGNTILYDRGGLKYDFKAAVQMWMKGMDFDEIGEAVKVRRRTRRKSWKKKA